MKMNNTLDRILDSKAKVKILRFLFKTQAEWNGRQIAKEVGVTPATAHKALQSLNKEGILLLHNAGKTHLYALNQDNFISSELLKPLFGSEKKILDGVFNIIRKGVYRSNLKKNIVSVGLFGSIGSRTEHSASDIDLVVIVKDSKIRSRVELLFEKIGEKISKEFGNVLSPYINTEAEFMAKSKNGLRIITNILKSNQLIYGRDLKRII